jgi:hypothetical protein
MRRQKSIAVGRTDMADLPCPGNHLTNQVQIDRLTIISQIFEAILRPFRADKMIERKALPDLSWMTSDNEFEPLFIQLLLVVMVIQHLLRSESEWPSESIFTSFHPIVLGVGDHVFEFGLRGFLCPEFGFLRLYSFCISAARCRKSILYSRDGPPYLRQDLCAFEVADTRLSIGVTGRAERAKTIPLSAR